MDNLRFYPHQASNIAHQVDTLFLVWLAISAFFSLLIFALIFYFALRYRRRSPNETGADISGNLMMETTWTLIPLVIMLVMFVFGSRVFMTEQTPPETAMEIDVLGKQWMWKIQHPEGRREIDELHLPIGKPIRLVMTSQDVIHDFSIPDFRVKQDVRPGAYSTEWFVPTQLGKFHIFCDQYCGARHAQMVGTVFVMKQSDYADWLAGAPSDVPPKVAGQKLFIAYGCASCHGQYAPTLAGLYGTYVDVIDEHGRRARVLADEAYLRESILYPNAKLVLGFPNRMPSFKGELSEEQLMQLIQYIKSLGSTADTGAYHGPREGATTQPQSFEPLITNPPFASYRTNK